jgi:L-asparaginase II
MIEPMSALPGHQPVAIATRGSHVENVHWGSAAVVNAQGELIASFGDIIAPVFPRSSIKPFQALPFVAAGGLQRFGWSVRETALLCASHSAEAEHLAVVEHMLASSGHSVAELGCGAHVPGHYAALNETPPAHVEWTALHNNCSGKHAGFLACCGLHGWSLADYLDPAHALQQAIRDALGELAGIDVGNLPRGIDGCSAPIYALPLRNLALAYARLAGGAQDTRWHSAAEPLRDAMRAQPQLISGHGRFDLALTRQGGGDWIVKGGADGVQTLASVSRGIGIAIKLADGNVRALNAVVIAVLRQLGWIDGPLSADVAAHDAPLIRNWRGTATGQVNTCLQLILG